MWAAIFYFLLGEPLARCKFLSEMNLQFIIIIGDMVANLADFSSFVSIALLIFKLAPRFCKRSSN